jgi:hypothetical protein
MRYSSYSFTTSALDGGEWSASYPGLAIPPRKGPPGTHRKGGWVGPRADLDREERGKILLPLPGIEPRSPGSPVRQCLRNIPILMVKRAYTFRWLMPWIRQIISFCVCPWKSGIMNRTCTADGIEYKSRQCFGWGYLWKISLGRNEEIK